MEDYGSTGGSMHAIPYKDYLQYAESSNGDKKLISYIYNVYGKNLDGIWEYDKTTKTLKVNDWCYRVFQLFKENKDLTHQYFSYLTDKYFEDHYDDIENLKEGLLEDIEKLENQPSNNTRSISPAQITENIKKMYEVARQNPDKQFKVAYTHGLNETSRNGYTGAEMIKMFKDAGPIPSNVMFSKNWTDHWDEVESSITQQNNPALNEATNSKEHENC